MAASGAYDVLAIVHDFPYRSLPSEVNTANEVTRELLAATADRPGILPVYVSLTSGEPPPETKALLDGAGKGAPLLRGAVEAFGAIAAVAAWEGRRDRRREGGPWRAAWPALARDRTSWGAEAPDANPSRTGQPTGPRSGSLRVLSEFDSLALLGSAGIPVVPARRAADPSSAVAAADALGYPVAVKIDAEGLPHKSEVGGLRLGLANATAVTAAAADLLALVLPGGTAVRGLVVEPMAPAGVELIVGMERDPQFGPVVLVGLGGVLAEAIDDTTLRLAPVPARDARAMLGELRGVQLLRGYRGAPPPDLDALAALVTAVGDLALARSDIVELDLNPVIAGPAGTVVVDALVVLDG
jgi:acyl-CoA synthetase (NDP forming)